MKLLSNNLQSSIILPWYSGRDTPSKVPTRAFSEKMSFRVEFLMGDYIVGSALCASLRSAVLRIKDPRNFTARHRATAARVFDIANQRYVYRFGDTSADRDCLIIERGGGDNVIVTKASNLDALDRLQTGLDCILEQALAPTDVGEETLPRIQKAKQKRSRRRDREAVNR